jgi:hypothetical protein
MLIPMLFDLSHVRFEQNIIIMLIYRVVPQFIEAKCCEVESQTCLPFANPSCVRFKENIAFTIFDFLI